MERKSIEKERKWNTKGTQRITKIIVNKGF